MSEVKILSEKEHIRKRPGMYIGDTSTPIHLLTEVLDNALDEAINGYAKKVKLEIDKDHVIRVFDDGRGIPTQEITHEGKTYPAVVFLCTKLFSGTKFSSHNYKYMVGQHGVGLTVVNALSLWMNVYVDGKIFKFKDFEFKGIEKDGKWKEYSTVVEFRPNGKIFKSLEFDINPIKDRLRLVQAITGVDIQFNNEVIKVSSLEEFIREQLGISKDVPLFKISVSGKADENQDAEVDVYFTYDMSSKAGLSPHLKGSVNLRQAEGTYLTNVSTAVVSGLYDNIKNNQKFILTKEDLKTRLRLYTILKINEPHYDSQTKVRYVGPSLGKLLNKISEQAKKLYKDDYIKDAISQINDYKILRKANSLKKTKSTTKTRISIGSPLRDCSSHPGEVLYVVEGPSAGNTLTVARNPKVEAVFPMQGKIINAESNRLDKVVNNKFVNFLLEAIGVKKLGEPFEQRYKKIAVLADADPDGLQIALLVTILIYKLIPDVIKNGNLIVIQPPLYGAVKGKEFIPIYKIEDTKKYRDKGYNIHRFKGLGEMTSSQMEYVIRHGKKYTVRYTQEGEKLVKRLFSSSDAKRELLNIPEKEIEKVLFGIS